MQVLAAGIAAVTTLVLLPQSAQATLNYQGGTYVQNFENFDPATDIEVLGSGNPLPGVATELPANPDWIAIRESGPGPTRTSVSNFPLSPGTGSEDGYFAFGTSADRSFGSAAVFASNIFGIEIQNETGRVLTEFTVGFNLEYYSGLQQALNFGYQITPTRLLDVPDANPDYVPNIGIDVGFTPLNPNPAPFGPNSRVVTGITWNPGQYLYFRFEDSGGSGFSSIAVDDFTFIAVPEPTTALIGGLLFGVAALARPRRRSTEAAALA